MIRLLIADDHAIVRSGLRQLAGTLDGVELVAPKTMQDALTVQAESKDRLDEPHQLVVEGFGGAEAGLFQFADEVFLGERAGHASGPGGGLGGDLGWQVVLFDGEV